MYTYFGYIKHMIKGFADKETEKYIDNSFPGNYRKQYNA